MMKSVFLLVFTLFVCSIVADAQENNEKYIEIIGSSELEVVPDEIIL